MTVVAGTAEMELAVDHLERLADGFWTVRWEAWVIVPAGGSPCVRVVNPEMRALNDHLAAAPDEAGQWWFWWSWAERIAPVADPGLTVGQVRRVLALGE
jgi:hypothetical protein